MKSLPNTDTFCNPTVLCLTVLCVFFTSASYHLCQMCFWRGAMTDEHKDDVFKEYSAWKTPGKPSGMSKHILRSFFYSGAVFLLFRPGYRLKSEYGFVSKFSFYWIWMLVSFLKNYKLPVSEKQNNLFILLNFQKIRWTSGSMIIYGSGK